MIIIIVQPRFIWARLLLTRIPRDGRPQINEHQGAVGGEDDVSLRNVVVMYVSVKPRQRALINIATVQGVRKRGLGKGIEYAHKFGSEFLDAFSHIRNDQERAMTRFSSSRAIKYGYR
jgi:hypothetical protein